jgi:hypothetical protein
MSEASKTMGKLAEQLELKLLPGMTIPEPIRSLYDWIESRSTYADGYADEAGGSEEEEMRTGFLFPEEEQMKVGQKLVVLVVQILSLRLMVIWVTETFTVSIPVTAAEIIKHPSEMDEDPEDEFAKWVNANKHQEN